jgi:predicted MPP superfamily phosphohydrolase
MSSHESVSKYTKDIKHALLRMAGAFLIVNFLLVGAMAFTGHDIFTLIANVYLSNFVVLPCAAIIYSIWSMVRRKCFAGNIIVSVISVMLIGVFIYATFIEPKNLTVEHITIQTDKFAGEIVVAHVTDFQSAKIGAYEEGVIDKLVELNPDIIFHTGDMVQPYDRDDRSKEVKALAVLFKKLNPKYGVYNVLGNLDRPQDSIKFDSNSQTTTLNNEGIIISDGGLEIDVHGLTFEQSFNGDRYAITNWLNNSRGKFTILLGHAPDYVLDIRDKHIDLCLSGHTHGGQVRLPFIGALLNSSKTPRSWARGYRKIENLHLNVSAGIGCEHLAHLPSIRFNCPPTITIFKIVGSKTE